MKTGAKNPLPLKFILTAGVFVFCLCLPAGTETREEERGLRSAVLSAIVKHYHRKIEPGELEKKSLREILESLDKDSSLLAGQKKDLDYVRGFTKLQTVEKPERIDHQTALIRIAYFSRSTQREFLQIYSDLKKNGVQRWVLDLRQNSGGDLRSCLSFLECFLPQGAVLGRIETRNGAQNYFSKNSSPQNLSPLVVLVDSQTASCAELAANTLKRTLHAKIAGAPTQGKQTVQEVFPVEKAWIALTVGRWSSGETGVKPETPILPDILLNEKDIDLKKISLLFKK
ncbi:MAG: S41 family peptidase [Elusimicrobia bacterium]|nr:S41 family peptidase [Elusimicrobiota bacterium]